MSVNDVSTKLDLTRPICALLVRLTVLSLVRPTRRVLERRRVWLAGRQWWTRSQATNTRSTDGELPDAASKQPRGETAGSGPWFVPGARDGDCERAANDHRSWGALPTPRNPSWLRRPSISRTTGRDSRAPNFHAVACSTHAPLLPETGRPLPREDLGLSCRSLGGR